MNEQEWIREFQDKGALWFTNGDPSRPHVLLPSGKHTDVYFDPENLLKDGLLLHHAARDLVTHLVNSGLDLEEVDLLVSPAREAEPAPDLAWHMSGLISSMTGRACSRMGIEREYGNNGPEFDGSILLDSQRALLVEDMITATTVIGLGEVAIKLDGHPLRFIAALLNVSGDRALYGVAQIALVHQQRHTWDAGNCPLCKSGSKAMRPEEAMKEWLDAA